MIYSNYRLLNFYCIKISNIWYIIYKVVTVRFAESRFAETHFAEAVSPNGRFAERTFRRTDVSPNGRFAEWTFRRKDVSPKGRFAERTFHRKDVSPKGRFAERTFRRKFFGLHYDNSDQNVLSVKWIRGNVHLVKRPFGETSIRC